MKPEAGVRLSTFMLNNAFGLWQKDRRTLSFRFD